MKIAPNAKVVYLPAGWKRAPESTLYLEAHPDNLQQHQLIREVLPIATAVGKEHSDLINKHLINISGAPHNDDYVLIQLSSQNAQAKIHTPFLDLDRNQIRFTWEQTLEHCDSFEQLINTPEIETFFAGIAWYRPKGVALFGTRTPQMYEFWDLKLNNQQLLLRISGPYAPKLKLPINHSTAEALQKAFKKSLGIDLTQAYLTAQPG